MDIMEIKKKTREDVLNLNLESLKFKIKGTDIINKNNWSNYKKKIETNIKNYDSIGIKIEKRIILVNTRNNLILMAIKNFKEYFKYKSNYLNKYNRNITDIYIKINFKKIREIKKSAYFKSFEKKIIIILDLRGLKNKIFFMNSDNCVLSLTPGVVFKKLNMNEKKIKKSNKIFYLMLKTAFIKINSKYNYKSSLVFIKGLKKKTPNLVDFLNKNIKSKKNIFIFTNKISFNKLKFKKIKSIKRRLKKKNIIINN